MARISHLKAIQVFDAVARARNLTQAAAALNIAQSAVSYHLQILETKIDAKLFERSARGVKLTEAGEKLLPFVREGLRSIEAGLAIVTAPSARPVVRVAVPPMFASRWLAPRLADFWSKYPKIELSFSHDNDVYSAASTHSEIPDLAVQWGTGSWPRVVCRRLLEAPLIPACSPKLLKRIALRAPSDLKRHTLLHVDDRNMWRQWLAAVGLPDAEAISRHGLMMSDRHFQLSATLNAAGVSLFVGFFISEELRQGTLVAPLAMELRTDYAYFLVRPKDRTLGPAAAIFHEWLSAQAAQSGLG